MKRSHPVALLFLLSLFASRAAATDPQVHLLRTPDRGIQPQAVIDEKGVLHLIYFKGDPAKGDVYYVRSTDGGTTFSKAIRVNSQAGSAIAIGTIRGAHLAIGKNGRVHVSWNGSNMAEPKGSNHGSPMLYARLADDGQSFEPQRNVVTEHYGLDGGGSVAADALGNVYVAWHAPDGITKGEIGRRVWVARSTDDGKTFTPETPATVESTGACGCCGLRAFASRDGKLFLLYRSATEMVNRDMYLVSFVNPAARASLSNLAKMKSGVCVMSSSVMTEGKTGVFGAMESEGQVSWRPLSPKQGDSIGPINAPSPGGNRKHPSLAVNKEGVVLLGWAEGTAWQKGGSLSWQLYNPSGKPVAGTGHADGIPVWSFSTAVALKDGNFVLIY